MTNRLITEDGSSLVTETGAFLVTAYGSGEAAVTVVGSGRRWIHMPPPMDRPKRRKKPRRTVPAFVVPDLPDIPAWIGVGSPLDLGWVQGLLSHVHTLSAQRLTDDEDARDLEELISLLVTLGIL